jgi:hypothetical protein
LDLTAVPGLNMEVWRNERSEVEEEAFNKGFLTNASSEI